MVEPLLKLLKKFIDSVVEREMDVDALWSAKFFCHAVLNGMFVAFLIFLLSFGLVSLNSVIGTSLHDADYLAHASFSVHFLFVYPSQGR